jgi:hypothetical protein
MTESKDDGMSDRLKKFENDKKKGWDATKKLWFPHGQLGLFMLTTAEPRRHARTSTMQILSSREPRPLATATNAPLLSRRSGKSAD